MLVRKLIQNFSKSRMKILLVEDFPKLGFEGEIVSVKPGFATNNLIPNRIAVYNFPGVRARLYPNISDEQLQRKKQIYQETLKFQKKIERISIDLPRLASFANQTILKKELLVQEIIKEVSSKYQIANILTENIEMEEPIKKFGNYKIVVKEYLNENLNKKFNFFININVIKQETSNINTNSPKSSTNPKPPQEAAQ